MDFKGVAWAGDIYDKFEAMCLEVEEIMYEDTVKYVENQAQKVGVSVKKLYAEVMQDLLLPSCLGPVPSESDINEKPKPAISDNRGELNNKQAGVEDICNLTAQNLTPSVGNDAAKRLSPTVLVGNTQSEECFRKSRRSGLTRCPIGIKRISHPSEASRAVSSLCDTRSNCLVANDDLNVTASSELFSRHDQGDEAVTKSRPISDASAEPCSSDQTAKSIKHEKENNKELPAESLRQDNDATECSSCHGFPPAPIDTLREDGSLSQINLNIAETRQVGSVGEETTASYEDNIDIEVIEPIEKSKLEESCILVEGNDELHFVSRGLKKHKSYKKKIYDVLSLKLRSTKKQDPCVSEHRDLIDAGVKCSALAMDCDERKLPVQNSCDSGWELL